MKSRWPTALSKSPVHPKCPSINLAQAVNIIAYEWYQAIQPSTPTATHHKVTLATKQELVGLFEHLESELDARDFFRVAEKRPTMVRNIRNLFGRAELTDQEVRSLRGIVKALTATK